MTDSSLPMIYRRIMASRLVNPVELAEVYNDLYQKLVGLREQENVTPSPVSARLSENLSASESDQNSFMAKNGKIYLQEEDSSDEGFTIDIDHPAAGQKEQDFETDFILEKQTDAQMIEEAEKGNFELGSGESVSVDLSDASREVDVALSSSLEEEMERFLPAELELRGLVNRWQVSQLIRSRTRFHLGEYRMIGSLGVGGYGQVFLARHTSDHCNLRPPQCSHDHINDVAVKVLTLANANEKSIEKFKREVELGRFFNHKNIVKFIDSSMDGNVHYAVYEYLDGGDVRKLINRFERIDYAIASTIIHQVAEALIAVHFHGIVHRDIKPGNILLKKDGSVRLLDFGLAVPYRRDGIYNMNFTRFTLPSEMDSLEEEERQEPEESIGNDKSGKKKKKVAGTPDYISPDQIRAPDKPSPLWDIYSLGCTFYFMVTGIVPFPAGTPRQKMQAQLYCEPPEPRMFDSKIPESLSRFILKMMAKNPEERVQNAEEIIRFLHPLCVSSRSIANALKTKPANSSEEILTQPNVNVSDSLLISAIEEETGPVQNEKKSQNKERNYLEKTGSVPARIASSDRSETGSPVDVARNESREGGHNDSQNLSAKEIEQNQNQDLLPINADSDFATRYRNFQNEQEKLQEEKIQNWTLALTYFLLLPLLVVGFVLLCILFLSV